MYILCLDSSIKCCRCGHHTRHLETARKIDHDLVIPNVLGFEMIQELNQGQRKFVKLIKVPSTVMKLGQRDVHQPRRLAFLHEHPYCNLGKSGGSLSEKPGRKDPQSGPPRVSRRCR